MRLFTTSPMLMIPAMPAVLGDHRHVPDPPVGHQPHHVLDRVARGR
jgi:hypothetical protein